MQGKESNIKKRFVIVGSLIACFGPFFVVSALFLWSIFSHGPINGTDLETPVTSSFYTWSFWIPWHPLDLGSERIPTAYDYIYAIIALLSHNNILLSQILTIFLTQLLSYCGLYLFARYILVSSRLSSILGALMFSFSPVYLAWFTAPLNFGYSLLPYILILLWLLMQDTKQNASHNWFKIILHALGFGVVLGTIFDVFFHIIPYLIFSMVVFFAVYTLVIKKMERSNLKLLSIALLMVIFFTLLFSGRIQMLFSQITSGSFNIEQPISIFKQLYAKASVVNVIRLSGGTPSNQGFNFFNGNIYLFAIPIVAFFGLLIFKTIKLDDNQKAIYLAALVNSLLLIGVIELIKIAANLNVSILETAFFAAARRPERFLALLTLFLAIQISASSFMISEWLKRCILNNINAKILNVIWMCIMLLLYIVALNAPSFSYTKQLWVSMPQGYHIVRTTVKALQSTAGDLAQRYLALPLFQPGAVFLSRINPFCWYVGSFAASPVLRLSSIVQHLFADAKPSVIYALGLASVRHIIIMTPSFLSQELQPWRFQGPIRINGSTYIFGSPTKLMDLALQSGIVRILSNNDTFTLLENEASISPLNISKFTIEYNSPFVRLIQMLPFLELIQPELALYGYVSFENKELVQGDIKISDIPEGKDLYIRQFRIPTSEIIPKFVEDFSASIENPPIVFGKVYAVKQQAERSWYIRASAYPENASLSVWFYINWQRLNDSKDTLWLTFKASKNVKNATLTIRDKTNQKDLFSCKLSEEKIVPEGNDFIRFYIKIPLTVIQSNSIILALKFSSLSSRSLDKQINISFGDVCVGHITGYKINLPLFLNTAYNNPDYKWYIAITREKSHQDCRIIVGHNAASCTCQGNFVLSPPYSTDRLKKEIIIEGIEQFKEVYILRVKTIEKNIKFIMSEKTINVNNPTLFKISFKISPVFNSSKEFEHKIIIPIALNLAYNKKWKIDITTSEGNTVKSVFHKIGNGFGNLWLITIDTKEMFQQKTDLWVHMRIYWDRGSLCLYRGLIILRLMMLFVGVWGVAMSIGNVYYFKMRRC